MQKTILIGNLGRDPKLKVFDNGGRIAEFSIGTTERAWKRKDGTVVQPATEWFNCIARGGLVDVVMNHTKKGHLVHVECRRQTRHYTDKEGNERTAYDYIVRELQLLTPKGNRNDPVPAADPLIPAPEERYTSPEEDLPF